MYHIDWTLGAELTYKKEIEFILSKWSIKEVLNFIELVEDKIQTLSSGIMTGKPSKFKDVRILVISKQTSLAYKIFEDQLRVELVTFWNNKMNPNQYDEFLEF